MTVPPLALLFICAVGSTVLARFIPLVAFSAPTWLVGLELFVGVAFLFPAVVSFVKNKTTVSPISPAEASLLVTDGVYSITRNPMYVGMLLLLLGFNLWLGTVGGFVMVLAFFVMIGRRQITVEEQALLNNFGEAYQDYATRVPRWLFIRQPVAKRANDDET